MYQYQNDWDENEWEGLGIEDDLISRRAMYIALYELGGCDATEDYYKGYDSGIGSAISALQCAPTVEKKSSKQQEGLIVQNLKPVVSGYDDPSFVTGSYCSTCGMNLNLHNEYYGEIIPLPKLIVCYRCGSFLDTTQKITHEEWKRRRTFLEYDANMDGGNEDD